MVSSIGAGYLSPIKSLRDVNLNGVRVSSATLNSVRRSLPEARVDGRPYTTSVSRSNYWNSMVKVVVLGDLTNAQKRQYLEQLKTAAGHELAVHIVTEQPDGTQFQFGPVVNIEEFAKQIKFGKVSVDKNASSIRVQLGAKPTSKPKPRPDSKKK